MKVNRVFSAALAALLVCAPAASAKDKQRGAACPDRTFTQVFEGFHDRGLYTLAPDGDFEAGAEGWELSDGAAVVEESSSILLGEALGARSLSLEAGASATTPAICVTKGFPSFRFVTRAAGQERTRVRVDVLYAGGRKSKKAGKIEAGADWRVTRKVSLAQGRFRVKRGRSAEVRLQFTAVGGPVQVDDVYVDPRLRR